ncbi:precorrin-6y C5,15-methyltransferase (decarboxylating) subunit CbiE [Parendozoicomonas haliclonae]|uniref:Precorrin-6Y C(5,15)-methyltransferase [decarboxylating] n=1 Tax=Parendozoicomonas haliclonae TaxID=1960125 RepID=A0A1X7AP00_9GAMM|nr:precorrin-6y C5,15-methyltransferase (decarboxylating) subunit CbiE [Parendozoicomonas haliclonae]SMA48831.1 Precorrin-6Y C(5,15)-methyltransferase [decarboxylating] [Parendozoicomonas haliclonae]
MTAITVIGMGDDGCASLSSKAVNAVQQAQVLAGSDRQLSFFPQFSGERLPFGKDGLQAYLDRIIEASYENTVCVLASGDPLFYGLGRRLAALVEPEHLSFIPSPSSIQLAFSALNMAWDDATVLSVHGRPLKGLVSRLQQGKKFALMTDHIHHPVAVAQHLKAYGETNWQIHICARLGGTEQSVTQWSVADLAAADPATIDNLNVMVLVDEQHQAWGGYPLHCSDDDYQKRMPANGLITKQEIRAIAVAGLGLNPDSVVWDIGAGSGSISVEAAKLAWRGEVYAIESVKECVAFSRDNAAEHRVDHLSVIHGLAPQALDGLPAPDAIFIGGTRGQMQGILEYCLEALQPGGRLLLSAVTLDTVSEAFTFFKQLGYQPSVSLINISRGRPLASYTGYRAENPIHLFTVVKGS